MWEPFLLFVGVEGSQIPICQGNQKVLFNLIDEFWAMKLDELNQLDNIRFAVANVFELMQIAI